MLDMEGGKTPMSENNIIRWAEIKNALDTNSRVRYILYASKVLLICSSD